MLLLEEEAVGPGRIASHTEHTVGSRAIEFRSGRLVSDRVINNSTGISSGPRTVLCIRRDSEEEVLGLQEIKGKKLEGRCGRLERTQHVQQPALTSSLSLCCTLE